MPEPFDVQLCRKMRPSHFAVNPLSVDVILPNQETNINVHAHGNCAYGGMHFPDISRPGNPNDCEGIDCDLGLEGTAFNLSAGNAIFGRSSNV